MEERDGNWRLSGLAGHTVESPKSEDKNQNEDNRHTGARPHVVNGLL